MRTNPYQARWADTFLTTAGRFHSDPACPTRRKVYMSDKGFRLLTKREAREQQVEEVSARVLSNYQRNFVTLPGMENVRFQNIASSSGVFAWLLDKLGAIWESLFGLSLDRTAPDVDWKDQYTIDGIGSTQDLIDATWHSLLDGKPESEHGKIIAYNSEKDLPRSGNWDIEGKPTESPKTIDDVKQLFPDLNPGQVTLIVQLAMQSIMAEATNFLNFKGLSQNKFFKQNDDSITLSFARRDGELWMTRSVVMYDQMDLQESTRLEYECKVEACITDATQPAQVTVTKK